MPRKSGGGSAAPSKRGADEKTITIGLVNVPVRLANAEKSRANVKIGQNYVCPTHLTKVTSPKFCEECGTTVEAVKMFPVEGGYVEIGNDALDEIIAEKTGELKLTEFVPSGEIDPLYLSKPLIVWPEGSPQVYDLLATAMRDAGVAGIGKTVLGRSTTERQIVLCWSAKAKHLVAYVCRYDDELKLGDMQLIADGIKGRGEPPAEQVELATQVIEMNRGEFDASAVSDSFQEALEEMLAKAKPGEPIKASGTAPAPKQEKPVSDVVADLRASLLAAKGGKPASKATAKKKAA